MTRTPIYTWSVILLLGTMLLAGCSRNPNVRKQKYFESGDRYFEKGQYAAAAIQFGNAIQVDPTYAAAHYQLAKTYLRLQDWNNSYRELSRTVELQPANYAARLDLATLLIAGGELKEAQEHVDFLAAQQPADPQVHVVLASLRATQGDSEHAIAELQKAIALNPNSDQAYLDLAFLQVKANQFDSAEINFKRAIALSPKETNPRLALGGFYQSRQRYGDAEQQFRAAIENDRQNPDPRLAFARLYMAEGKKADAEAFLKDSKKDFVENPGGYRMLGDFYFAIGDFDNAVAEYTILNREHPKDLQVTKNYVQLLIIKNRLEEARKLDNAVFKAKPRDVDALIERGQIQYTEGHLADAVQTLQNAINNETNNGLAYYHLGVALARMGKMTEAENAWQSAVRYRPDLFEAQRALALGALRKGDMTELVRYASALISLQPTSAEGYAMRALSYTRRGQFAEAEPDVLKAIEVAPQSPMGYLQMGNLMLARKDYRQAENAYQQALARDGSSSDALAGLMSTYLEQNQVNKALAAAQAQIALVPDMSPFYDLLGTTLFDHKRSVQDVDDAQASLEKAVQLDRHNVDAWLKLSQVQASNGSTDNAVATCEKALGSNPGEASVYILMGQLYESNRDQEKAKEAYRKALQINPQNAMASNNLAYILLQTGGNPDIAMPLAQAAMRGMPESPQAADTMGWVFFQKGAYKSAIDLFQEALKRAEKNRFPDNPNVHFHLGLAYQKIGQPALARQQLLRVLKISPNYSSADDVKKLLLQLPG